VLPFVLKRVIWAGMLLLVISLITFVIFFVLPAQPVNQGALNTDDIGIRDAYEFSGPIYQEYAQFVRGIFLEGSLGRSLSTRDEITEILWRAAPVTASLVIGGMLLVLLLAVPLGILSALRPRSLFDRSAMLFVFFGVSAHPAWIGLVLAYFLGFRFQVMPLSGYCDFFTPSTDCGGPVQWTYHLLLPWFTFAILFAAMYARMIRASVLEGLGEDYVRTARAKGLPERRVVRSHVLRNALLPVATMVGLDAGVAFGGVIFVERVFGLPGLGGVMLQGLTRRDPPIVLGVVVFVAMSIVLFNLLVDLVYTALDPRIRADGRERGLRERGRTSPEPAPVVVGTAPTSP